MARPTSDMLNTSIRLDPGQLELLREVTRERRCTISFFLREAIADKLLALRGGAPLLPPRQPAEAGR